MSKPRASKLFIEVYTDRMNELLDAELDGVPQAEISEAFDTRMNTLIERETKRRRQRIGIKRALIAAAAVTVLFLIACAAVPALRSSVAGFLFREYEDHGEIFYNGVTREAIDAEYRLSFLPEGFYEADSGSGSRIVSIHNYEKDESSARIVFQQIASRSALPVYDTGGGDYYETSTGGLAVRMQLSDTGLGGHAMWVHDGYFFMLSVIDYPTDEALLSELIVSVEKAE